MPIENHRALFESAPDGIIVVDPSGRIRDANPAAEQMFGYARHELEGKTVETLVPEDRRAEHGAHRDRYTAHPVQRPMGIGMELSARRKDGTTFPVEISLNVMDSAEGKVTIATVRDVSLRKRLRDFGAGALRAAEEVRTRIARDLHDDTAQQVAAHLVRLRLAERARTDEERDEHLRLLRQGLEETAEGVRRIARGLRPPELEDAGLLAAFRSVGRRLHETSGLEVDFDVVSVDPYLTPDGRLVLYRIVQEALSNAARHSGSGRARVVVRVSDGMITAEVSDRGRGFHPDATMLKSAGLGLIGMRERAVMVGGRLEVDSQPGQGTRVRVVIPVEFDAEVERV